MKKTDFQVHKGMVAKDRVTGFEGVVISHCEYLTGCSQYLLQPPLKDGVWVDSKWFDINKLDMNSDDVTQVVVDSGDDGCDVAPPTTVH